MDHPADQGSPGWIDMVDDALNPPLVGGRKLLEGKIEFGGSPERNVVSGFRALVLQQFGF
jgi:hypothetical protein